MGGGAPSTTTSIQDIPPEFKAAFTSLFNSAMGAARTSAYPSFDLPQGMGNLGMNTQGQSPYPMMSYPGMGSQAGGKGAPGGGQQPLGGPQAGQYQGPQAGGLGSPAATQLSQMQSQYQGQPGSYQNPMGQGAYTQGFTGQPGGIGGVTGTQPGATQTGAQTQGVINPPLNPQQPQQPQQPDPLGTPGTGQPPATGGKGSRRDGGSGRPGMFSQQQQPSYNPLPSGNVRGTSQIPLAGGEPIIGQPFPGPFTAGTHPLEMASLFGRQEVGENLAGAGNALGNLGQATAQGYFLDAANNPYLQSAMQAAANPAIQNFTNSVMPQFNSQAVNSGAFKGSSARDLATNQLASGFGNQLTDMFSQMSMQNYGAERQLQQNAGQLIDQSARLNQLSPEILAQTGEGWRALQQRTLDEALLQYQEQIQAPFRPLMPLASIIQGGDIGSSMTTMTPQSSAAAQGIAGALGGAGMGAGVANAFGQQGGWGAGITGLGGALGGLLGGL